MRMKCKHLLIRKRLTVVILITGTHEGVNASRVSRLDLHQAYSWCKYLETPNLSKNSFGATHFHLFDGLISITQHGHTYTKHLCPK